MAGFTYKNRAWLGLLATLSRGDIYIHKLAGVILAAESRPFVLSSNCTIQKFSLSVIPGSMMQKVRSILTPHWLRRTGKYVRAADWLEHARLTKNN